MFNKLISERERYFWEGDLRGGQIWEEEKFRFSDDFFEQIIFFF